MRHCYVVDVFTHEGKGGNPLGVVPDAVGLDDDDMQAIAAELGFSETVFIEWNETAPHLRIFTPARELPFAGHPLVGTAWVLNVMGPGCDLVTIAAGEVPISIDGDVVWVQAPVTSRPVKVLTDPIDVASRLEVDEAGMAAEVEVPMRFLYLQLQSEDAVSQATPDLERVREDFDGLYLFSRSKEQVRSRFFAPAMGIDEDPATGAAAVGLAALFAHLGEKKGTTAIIQGRDDLSQLNISWEDDSVRLGGLVIKRQTTEMDR